MSDPAHLIATICVYAPPIMFAIILHEVMHGVVANWLGDDTASRAGRLTLNPIAHIDPIGTIIVPAILIFAGAPVLGWARPVPVNFSRLRNGRTGMMMVAAAGPLTNFSLAAISVAALQFTRSFEAQPWAPIIVLPLALMLRNSLLVNVELGIFNLVPILPLDGGRVLNALLPLPLARTMARFEPMGFLLLFLLLYSPGVNRFLSVIMLAVARAIYAGVTALL